MQITIAAVGKVREPYLQAGCAEYLKRLGRYATVGVTEVAEEPAPETLSAAEQAQVLTREGDRLRRAVKDGSYVIALTLAGRSFTSDAFAAHLQGLAVSGTSSLTLLIGGSLGLAPALEHHADLPLSFGAFTYPHQLIRLMLLEQLYRAFKIMRGEPYHK
jgi:23S rRNA (pseudouridine1915-N3)-methyltransferase